MTAKIDDDHLVRYDYLAVFDGARYKFRRRVQYAATNFYQKKSERHVADKQAERWAIGQANAKGWDLQEIYPLPKHGLLGELAIAAQDQIKFT